MPLALSRRRSAARPYGWPNGSPPRTDTPSRGSPTGSSNASTRMSTGSVTPASGEWDSGTKQEAVIYITSAGLSDGAPLRFIKELDLAGPSGSHEVDDSLVTGAGPGARGISQRRDVWTVDEDLDIVEDRADGGVMLRHPPQPLVRVARVGKNVLAPALAQRPDQCEQTLRLDERLPSQDRNPVVLAARVHQCVGQQVHRDERTQGRIPAIGRNAPDAVNGAPL